jgi:superkiller protein 3
MSKARLSVIGLAIFAGAFAVRLVYLLHVKDLPMYYQAVLDTGFFQGWASTLRQPPTWLEQQPWVLASSPFREPLYAYFLALIHAGLRESLNLVRVVQCIMGGLVAVLVYSTARRLYGLTAGVIAGVLFALCIPAVFFASELNEATLTLTLLAAAAYLLVRANEDRPYFNAWLSGLLAGAAFISSFIAAAALPAWLAGSLASRKGRVKRAALIMLVGFVTVPLSFQFILTGGGERTLLPLRASWQAFLGSGSTGGSGSERWYEINVAGLEGAYKAIAMPGRIEGQRDAMRFAAIEDTTISTPAEAHEHWQQRTMEDFAASPARSLATYFTKLGLFWGTSQPPANMDMRFMARYSPLLNTRLFSFGVIAVLGLLGIALGTVRRGLHLTLFVALTSLFTAFFLVSDTAKVLVVPFLCVFGGYFAAEIIRRLRKGETARVLGPVAGAAIVGVLLSLLPAKDIDRVANLVTAGDVYGDVAVFDRAEELYREAIADDPDRPEPYASLAKLYGNTGRAQAGVELLNSATAGGLEDPRVRIELASLLIMGGRYDEALSELEKARKTHPYEPRLHQLIGMSLLETGRPDAALEQLEKELDYVGGGFITYSALGRAEFELGRYEDAARHLESALFWNPYNAPASVQLADAYSKMGQYLKACEVLGGILAVDPGNMPLRFKLANCLFRADRHPDALKHLKELYKYDPGNADILVNMGTVYAGMDSLDRAVETWERALVLDPDNEMAKDNLKLAEEEHE